MSSMQTTLARANANAAEASWRAHKSGCATCQPAARRRAWADLCPAGRDVRELLGHTRRELGHQRGLDKLPAPGQGTLI